MTLTQLHYIITKQGSRAPLCIPAVSDKRSKRAGKGIGSGALLPGRQGCGADQRWLGISALCKRNLQ